MLAIALDSSIDEDPERDENPVLPAEQEPVIAPEQAEKEQGQESNKPKKSGMTKKIADNKPKRQSPRILVS